MYVGHTNVEPYKHLHVFVQYVMHTYDISYMRTPEKVDGATPVFFCVVIYSVIFHLSTLKIFEDLGIFILKRLQKHNHPQAKEKDVGANTTITSLEYVFEMIIHVRLERAHTYMYTYV